MWENFKMRLGKFVQDIKNIFRKKNKTQEWDNTTFSVGTGSCDGMLLGPGQITIIPLANINEAELPVNITWEEPKSCAGKKPETFSDLSDEEYEELKNLLSGSLTVLPKRYLCKTLIVSCYANWEYDSVGVDISRLETESLAHYWCTSVKSMEEWNEALREKFDDYEGISEEEDEEHIVLHEATLTDWGNNYWTWDI